MNHDTLQQQFSTLYDEYADPIFRHCYFRINDRDRAIDLMQETFMRSWRYASKGNEIREPRAFLYRVANNLIINEYERRKRTSSIDKLNDETDFEPATYEHEEMQTRLDAELVIKHLDTLNESYRDVLVMRYIDDLAVKDIATILGENENNIAVRIHRALNKLRKYIDETFNHEKKD